MSHSNPDPLKPKFWEHKSLDDMSDAEWEAVCDGCGNCCRVKLEDEDTGAVAITPVVCKLLDLKTSQCSNYKNRRNFVPDCIQLDRTKVKSLFWLPPTCAYRLLDQGESLPDWHYLICGDKQRVHDVGVAVGGDAIHEDHVAEDDLPDLIEYVIERS